MVIRVIPVFAAAIRAIGVYKNPFPFQNVATEIDQQADAKFRGGQIVQHLFDVRVGQFSNGFGFKDTNGLRHEFHEFTLIGSAVFVIVRGIRVEPSCTSCLRANHSNQIT